MNDSPPDAELRLPADSAYLAVLRTATAGLAARINFTIDDIEDLRIAVDEACAILLPQAVPASELQCRFWLGDATMTVAVGATCTDPRPPAEQGFAWRVLSALTTFATSEVDDDRVVPWRERSRRERDRRVGQRSGPAPADRGALRGPALERGRGRGGSLPRRARRAAPAARGVPRPPVRQPRRAARGPRAGGDDRPHQGDRPVRPRARGGVLDVRDPHDRRRDQAALPR